MATERFGGHEHTIRAFFVAMAGANDVFDDMIRNGIRPPLKALGFIGSGSTFVWPSESTYSQLGFQKSQFSSRDALKFTINVTAADKVAWETIRRSRPHFPAKPSPNTFYGSSVWQQRIGTLLPSGDDTWWTIEADAEWQPVANEIVDLVTRFVMPALLRRR